VLKTGQDPDPSKPFIAFQYREHPWALTGGEICSTAGNTLSPVSAGGQFWGDNIYITSYAATEMRVRVKVGTTVLATLTLPAKQALINGPTRQSSVAWGSARGRPTFGVLDGNGNVVASKEGEVEYTDTPIQRNGKVGRNTSTYSDFLDVPVSSGQPVATLTAVDVSAAEGNVGQTTHKYRVTLNAAQTKPVKLTWAVTSQQADKNDFWHFTQGAGSGQCGEAAPAIAKAQGLEKLAFCDDFSTDTVARDANPTQVSKSVRVEARAITGGKKWTTERASYSWGGTPDPASAFKFNSDGTLTVQPTRGTYNWFMSSTYDNRDGTLAGYWLKKKSKWYMEIRWKFARGTAASDKQGVDRQPGFWSMDTCHLYGLPAQCPGPKRDYVEPDVWEYPVDPSMGLHYYEELGVPQQGQLSCGGWGLTSTKSPGDNIFFSAGLLFTGDEQRYTKDGSVYYTRRASDQCYLPTGSQWTGRKDAGFIFEKMLQGDYPVLIGSKKGEIITIDYVRVWEAGAPNTGEAVRSMPVGEVTIPAGQTAADIDVLINGDTAVEPNEPYTLTVTSADAAVSGSPQQGTIVDDDGAGGATVSIGGDATIAKGGVGNFTLSRSGNLSSGDTVRWAVRPVGVAPAREDDFPPVLSDDFSGSALDSALWCAAEGAGGDPHPSDPNCPAIPSSPLLGLWAGSLVTVGSGSLSLGIDHDAGTWTGAQIYSRRAFQGGLLKYKIDMPAGKGGAVRVWRQPETFAYGPGPRSGSITDLLWYGKTSADRNKVWRSEIQYSGADDSTAPFIASSHNPGTAWADAFREAQTRWLVGDGSAQFAFSVAGTAYWQPSSDQWPATEPWYYEAEDELGDPVIVSWPGGGGASPIDRPFRIVLETGAGGADSAACSGETGCPDAAVLDGAASLVDWVRYYQYPSGEVTFSPGQSAGNFSISTADIDEPGNRSLEVVILGAEQADIGVGVTAVSLVTGDPGVSHGSETYNLDFGKEAGGFTDQFGTVWQNGNSFVTGGTALKDTEAGTGTATWKVTGLESPPAMTQDPLIVEDVCPEDPEWPTYEEGAGRDIKVVLPTDRDCEPNRTALTCDGEGGGRLMSYLGGTDGNPARNIWVVGGKIFNKWGQGSKVCPNGEREDKGHAALSLQWFTGTAFIEGVHVDLACTCEDVVRVNGHRPNARVVLQNMRAEGFAQCSPGTHGDLLHPQSSRFGTLAEAKLENVAVLRDNQVVWGPPRPSTGHGIREKLTLDHVSIGKRDCPQAPGDGWVLGWKEPNSSLAPTNEVRFNKVFIDPINNSYGTTPRWSSFDGNNCAVYPASANVKSGQWCRQSVDPNTFAPLGLIGRNYARANFTSPSGGGSSSDVNIANARVERLDQTRLVGNTLAIVLPVNTQTGKQRFVRMGFSARDETAIGQRVFDISGAVTRAGFDIFSVAGARDTETVIEAPVTVSDDGYLRISLTGKTGQAQINWMQVLRPTVSVSLDKATYSEGDTVVATFTRQGPTEPAVTMTWDVRGLGAQPADAADFGGTLPTGTATFAKGATSAVQTFVIAADARAEPQEGFRIVLAGGSGADIFPGRGSAEALIAASADTDGDGDGGDTGGGGGGGGGSDPVCYPEGALRKNVSMTSQQVSFLRKAFFAGRNEGWSAGDKAKYDAIPRKVMRALDTSCTKADVCIPSAIGGACVDPKGLQADTATTAVSSAVRVSTVGRFPDLDPRARARDTFTYNLCDQAAPATCVPVVVELNVTGVR